ncbi:MAG: hypothetical protein O7D32_00095 [bacterium]|nr:hypothetical protein [bacterium]
MRRFCLVLVSIALGAPLFPSALAAQEESALSTHHIAAGLKIACVSLHDGLGILYVADPASPKEVGFVPLRAPALSSTMVLRIDRYAHRKPGIVFVAQGESGFAIIDISDPANAGLMKTVRTAGSAKRLSLMGSVLAVAEGNAGVSIYDVSNPSEPTYTRTFPIDGTVQNVRQYNGRLFACAGTAGLFVIDIVTGGTAPVPVAIPTAGDARDVAFYRNAVFVADGRHGVTLLNLTDRDNPKIVMTLPVKDEALEIVFHKSYVFVADGKRGVGYFKFDRPGTLEYLRQLGADRNYVNHVTVADRNLFVSGEFDSVIVFDIHRQDRPKRLR